MKSKTPHRKRRKRIGLGPGSGHGKTSTKGHKGQRARSGFRMRASFEGGQTPLFQRVGKRGFNRPFHDKYALLNLSQLDGLGTAEITPEWLLANRVIKRLGSGLKILGSGEVKQKLKVFAHRFSARAKKGIEQAGGEAVLIGGKKK